MNNAANPLHLAEKLVKDEKPVLYKVAWVGGANVLFDREKLLDVGGFSRWDQLPAEHAGEEVLPQLPASAGEPTQPLDRTLDSESDRFVSMPPSHFFGLLTSGQGRPATTSTMWVMSRVT